MMLNSSFSGFSVPQESGILSTDGRRVSRSPNLLCPQMDESPRNSGIHRTVRVPGEITHESSPVLPPEPVGTGKVTQTRSLFQ